jgi:hypothetical protein
MATRSVITRAGKARAKWSFVPFRQENREHLGRACDPGEERNRFSDKPPHVEDRRRAAEPVPLRQEPVPLRQDRVPFRQDPVPLRQDRVPFRQETVS